MMYINKIEILSGEVLDLNQRIKEKKVEDKQEKVDALRPLFEKSQMRISVSHAYAGGYELTVNIPTPAEFFKKEKHTGGMDEFIRQLHEHINEKIGKWLGTPYIQKSQRAKQGMINVEAMWHFYDAFFAYSLGLNLSEWHSSGEVVDMPKIHQRMLLAEKAWKEFTTFRSIANKKLKLRSQDENEKNEIWKSEFMPDWIHLTDKWKEKGISYSELSQSRKDDRQQAVGSLVKIQSHYSKIYAEEFIDLTPKNEDLLRLFEQIAKTDSSRAQQMYDASFPKGHEKDHEGNYYRMVYKSGLATKVKY